MFENRPNARRSPCRLACVAALAVAVAAALSAAPAVARSRHPAPTTPGTYTDWNGEIDQVEIMSAWKLGDYRRVSVATFDTSGVPLPEPGDNTYEPVKVMLAGATAPFVAGLAQGLRKGIDVGGAGPAGASDAGPASQDGPKTLLIRARVLTMDPGSRAARYWGGFGAGAARAKVSGELVDADSGAVLVRFTQERRSGFGIGGGGYVELMSRNLRTIGKDVAAFLNAF